MDPHAQPQPLAPAEQEICFAIVLYGGVSLAIYIHGVVQELLRLVRSTSGADLGTCKTGDEVARIYRDLSREVRAIDENSPGGSGLANIIPPVALQPAHATAVRCSSGADPRRPSPRFPTADKQTWR